MRLIKEVMDLRILAPEESGLPIKASLSEGDLNSKLCILVGDNASGKSLFVKLLGYKARASKPKVEPLEQSMRLRTASGMHRVFMGSAIGDAQSSTGNESLVILRQLLSTARQRDTPNFACLDEPDVGLSEAYTRALGKFLVQELSTLTETNQGVLLVTHSKVLVRTVLANSPVRPWFVHMGDAMTLEEWLADESEKSVEDLLALQEKAFSTFRAIEALR